MSLALIVALALAAGCKRSPSPAPSASASASVKTDDPMADLPDGAIPEPSPRVLGSTSAPRPAKTAAVVPKRVEEPKTATRIFDDYGFPVVSHVEHLCGRRDYPLGGGHLTWDAFATDVAPGELVSRYEKRLGKAGLERKVGGGTWRLPVDAATERTLEVMAPGAAGPHRSCKAKPAAGAKAVILVSRR